MKVRGYRIELGEIEAVLGEHPAVGEAVALVREDAPGDQRLVAYFVPSNGRRLEPAELRRFVQTKLPDYMVPAAFVAVAAWPLAPTGKLDRKALPAPGAVGPESIAGTWGAVGESSAATPAGAAPREGVETVIAELWCEALGIERVGRDDNFFALGGHSLLLTRVHARLEQALGRRVPMVELFRHPTVAALAAQLQESTGGGDGRAAGAVVAVAAAGPAPVALAATGATAAAVAIVGMAGRFPGAPDVAAFWRLLRDGVEGIRVFTDEELLAVGVERERLADPRLVRARGALDDADRFDAALFGFSPREAQMTDPQQRLFLEAAWAGLEDAGYDPRRFTGRTGVFAGVSDNGYGARLLADPEWVAAVGRFAIRLANQVDYVATRVSFKLDLQGPSLTVQTACSTSLVAVHLACRALAAGECDLALAGGASAQLEEVGCYLAVEGGIDSMDGHTRAFDAGARGVVAGSGVGVVVLKRLADAIADGDSIRAVLRGSAVNNDGANKAWFTAPSEEGQARVIAGALAAAGIGRDEIETVRYVEAHGTGTPLGDPIEVAGLTRAFRPLTERRGFCALGSVKTNVGHLDAAAGVAGLIKAALAVERGEIPPSLHFTTPNPEIDFAESPFHVPVRSEPWPEGPGPRRAGVSSFGIGGTNAHAVLEAPPPAAPSGEARPVHLLLVSGRTPEALAAAAERLAERLERGADGVGGGGTRSAGRGRGGAETRDDRALADVSYTLAVGRRQLVERRAVVCRGAADGAERLRAAGRGRLSAAGRATSRTPVAFLFPGQGVQFVGMAAELYSAEPVFRRELDRCAEALGAELGADLRRVLFPPAGAGDDARAAAEARLVTTELAQPALFAVELALARLWQSWGVEPAALLGHSLGELTAACLAGVFAFEDALALVAARGRLMGSLPAGAMAAVAMPAEAVLAEIGGIGEVVGDHRGEGDAVAPLALAAVNGPEASVVSGEPAAVAGFLARLRARGVAARPLATAHAFHSPAVDAILAPFREVVAGLALRPPRIPMLSNVTGGWLSAEEATAPDYWVRHLRWTVRFADGLSTLLTDRPGALLEIGPGRTLSALARQHPERGRASAILPSLAHSGDREGDLARLLAAVGGLWCAGVPVAVEALFAGQRRHRVPLPTYPFERRRFTPDFSSPAAGGRGRGRAGGGGRRRRRGRSARPGRAGGGRGLGGAARGLRDRPSRRFLRTGGQLARRAAAGGGAQAEAGDRAAFDFPARGLDPGGAGGAGGRPNGGGRQGRRRRRRGWGGDGHFLPRPAAGGKRRPPPPLPRPSGGRQRVHLSRSGAGAGERAAGIRPPLARPGGGRGAPRHHRGDGRPLPRAHPRGGTPRAVPARRRLDGGHGRLRDGPPAPRRRRAGARCWR